MRNTTIRKTGSTILAMVIGISSMASPITAQAMTVAKPTACDSCNFGRILNQVLASTQA